MSVLLAAMVAVQVVSADVTIDLESRTVAAEYVVAAGERDSVVFHALGAPGDGFRRLAGPSVTRVDGMLTATAAADGQPVVLRYGFGPDVRRIPVFAPDVPSDRASRIRIRISGVPGDARLSDGFPRLRREVGGSVVAEPANVPSFLALPPTGRWSVDRVADLSVVGLLVFATAFWILWRRRS